MFSLGDLVSIKKFETRSTNYFAKYIVENAPVGLIGKVTDPKNSSIPGKPIRVRIVWEGYKSVAGHDDFTWYFKAEDLELVYSG